MASLVKNGDNYGLIWTDKSRQQPQTRESLKTANLRKAKRRKAHLEDQYYEGKHDPWKRKWYQREKKQSLLLSEAVEEFILFKTRAKGRDGWSENVAKRETYVLRKFVRFVGDKPIDSLSKSDLEDFYYRPKVTSDHTRNGNYISVNTFLNWCVKNGYVKDKPEYRPKKPQTTVPKFIYPEDFAKLVQWRTNKIESDIESHNVMQEDRGAYWVVLGWMILAGTGLRPGELARIKLSHIERNSILVGADFTTKVRKERWVPLLYESKQAVDILSNSRFRSMERTMQSSPYLLGRKPSYSEKELSYEFTEAWGKCFPNKTKRKLYHLKDMYCVRFLYGPDNKSIDELKNNLGHASIATTEKYLKAVPPGTVIEGTIWDYMPVS